MQRPVFDPAPNESAAHPVNSILRIAQDLHLTVVSLFEAYAAQTPDAIAVNMGVHRLTYRELNEQANRLAHHLLDLGLAAGEPVALCMQRSPELLAAILGILKAGGGYLPLEAEYPQERLAFMLGDAKARLLLCHDSLRTRLPITTQHLIAVDGFWQTHGHLSIANPSRAIAPDDLLYIMYTSGSTGTPKGVRVCHRGVVRLVRNPNYMTITPTDVGLLLSTIAFDASTFDIWAPLLNGARLAVLPPGPIALDVLGQVIRDEGVTILFLTTGLFHVAVEECVEALRPLRWLLTGGDVVRPALARKCLEALPRCTLVNCYGPTENTAFTTCFPMTSPDQVIDTVPIGRPVTNTTVYVLDEQHRPVAAGLPGELYTGGDGLAQGYHGRPDLTADRFLPDPFSASPGARMYRTGDLVRMRQDGVLEFVGRRDAQVKIRGYRIELEEIELALARHPRVRAAAVVAVADADADRQLHAFIVSREGAVIPADLADFVRARLPEYMVPGLFSAIDKMPLAASGKLDRQVLTEMARQRGAAAAEFTAPTTPLEVQMAHMWAELLRIDRVGRNDHFFALGGHSLLATQLTARLRARLGYQAPLRLVYEHPVMRDYADALAAFAGADRAPTGAITAQSYSGPEPLSPAQHRLWFLDQYNPALPVYVIPSAFRIHGPLNVSALEQALCAVGQRHESLRTMFEVHDGTPRQRVVDQAKLQIALVDLASMTPERREAEGFANAVKEAAQAFDLTQAPLVRSILFRIADEDHLWLLLQHHIISDGWSQDILLDELARLYSAGTNGQPANLPEVEFQYRDYARWQHQWLQGRVLDELEAYWRERLDGAPQVLELPTDFPRPTTPQFRGARERIALDSEETVALKHWCRGEGVTPYAFFLSALFVLFHRYSHQQTVVLGTAVANRGRPEWERIIGFFVNSLPIRAEVHGDVAFHKFVRGVHRDVLEDFEHQEMPFDKLVEKLAPHRDVSRHPLFQVMFVMHNRSKDVLGFDNLAVTSIDLDNGTSKFDLTFTLNDRGSAFEGYVEYDLGLFERARIRRLVEHMMNIVRDALRRPEAPLCALTLLSDAERRQLLAWSGEKTSYPRNAAIMDLFEAQAAERPDAIAIRSGAVRLTYAELNAQANRLAHYLLSQHAQHGAPVGLALERSPALVAAILAVLKTGSPYVPLDPDYPRERLEFMIWDAGVQILLCQESLRERFDGAEDAAQHEATAAASKRRRLVLLDDFWESPPAMPDTNPPRTVAPTDLAYIMYTSGSTGTPKGVRVPHRAVIRLVRNTNYITITPEDVFLLMAPLSFDASTLEIWGPLLNGAALSVMPPGPVSLDALRQTIRQERVTILWLTAGLFHVVVEEALDALRPLRCLLAGGDVLRPDAVRTCLETLPGCTIINGYGPTENTTFTCCCPMTSSDQVGHTVPIGVPIANTSVCVLDQYQQPVPIGVPGELYVGGDGLAQGYQGRPDLTAIAFVPHPLPGEAGSVLYRTGDQVRFRDDGRLEFLGRFDTQVKIRGYRIELEEVEHALRGHQAVRDAALVAASNTSGDKRLYACVVLQEADHVPADLPSFMRARVPDFMLPTAYVSVPALPLSANGKVDRQLLAEEAQRQAVGIRDFTPPATPFEADLAALWADLLQVPRVGRQDDFFALGGHSLLATQMLARLYSLHRVDVPVRTIFRHPTLAAFAAAVEALRQPYAVAPRIMPCAHNGPLPLSFAQRRLWYLEQLVPGTPAYTIPTFLRVRGHVHVDALRGAVQHLVQRHAILRAVFPTTDGEGEQRILDAVVITLHCIDLTGVPEPDREKTATKLVFDEARIPFDLAHGPLVRFRLVALAPADHMLIISVHHIVSDGWSQQILLEELLELYKNCRDSQQPALPPLPIQYADYAVWQRNWLQGAVLKRQRTYWSSQLQGAPLVLDLPLDFPRPPVQRYVGKQHPVRLSEELTARLCDYSRAEGVTLFVTLLSAFQALIHALTEREDFIVGSVIANRHRADVERLVGFFANTLALRARPKPTMTFRDLVLHTHETVLGAHDHQDLPLEILAAELHPQRDRSRTPLIQIVFSLHRSARMNGEEIGWSIVPINVDNGTAKFDLSLLLDEVDGEVRGFFEYNTDLFAEQTISLWQKAYERLLEETLLRPERTLAEISAGVRPITTQLKPAASLRPEPQAEPQLTASGLAEHDSLPQTALHEILLAIWRELLRVKHIGIHDNFFDIGGHSLLATQLLERLRKRLQCRVRLDEFYAEPTIAGLAKRLAAPITSAATVSPQPLDPCIVPIKAAGSRTPFFCVSGAGGPVFNYFGLAPFLDAEQPFYGLQSPHLDEQSAHLASIEELASYYLRAIKRLQPVGPYLLGGWSFGGTVAYEMGRQLVAAGERVAFLGLIDSEADPLPANPWQSARRFHRIFCEKIRGRSVMFLHTMPLLFQYARDGGRLIFDRMLGRRAKAPTVNLRDYVRWVVRDQASQYFLQQARIAQVDALTSRVELLNDDRVRLITDVYTINASMLRHYVFKPYPGTVDLFRAKHDPWGRRHALGWDEVAGQVRVHQVEGNHLVIFRNPYVMGLAESLSHGLARAQGYAEATHPAVGISV